MKFGHLSVNKIFNTTLKIDEQLFYFDQNDVQIAHCTLLIRTLVLHGTNTLYCISNLQCTIWSVKSQPVEMYSHTGCSLHLLHAILQY